MNDINKYIDTLKQFSEKKLKTEYDIDKLQFDDFGLINSYLIYQSIKDKKHKKNTLIYLSDKESKSKFYVPVIFTVALHSFTDNYIDNTTVFEVNDIVQKNGERYKIAEINNDKIKLIKQDKYNTTIFSDTEKIKKYILTTANLQNHHVRKQFEMYKKLFADVLYLSKQGKNNIELPSKFKYKSIIVTDKKIEKELKQYEIENNKIHKAFPFRYITKTGTIKDNLPIAPMIYIVNDYQTARTHILDKNINIRNLVFIGANKYKDYLLEISEDLNNKRIENALFIGSADIENNAIPELQKWKWTLTELNQFNYFETYEIKTIKIENEHFSKLLQEFNNIIKQIENEHDLDLKELYKYARNILPIVIPNSVSRLIKQLDNLLIYFEKEGLDIIETEFYKIDQWEFEDIWTEILEKFKEIINYQKTNYFKYVKIQKFEKIDYLVVPKEYVGIWKEEVNTKNVKNIISYKEYQNLKCKQGKKEIICTNKTIVFIGFYGYSHLKSMIYNSNKIAVLLYPEELQYFKSCYDSYKKDTYSKIKDADRNSIAGISFKTTETEETVSDLIKRLFEKGEKQKITPDYTASSDTNLIYELTFEEGNDILELDENKTILLKVNGKERDEIVKNLKIGDTIRVYGNATKEELYKIAMEADTEGTFKAIEYYSQIWKKALKEYSTGFNNNEELLQHLKNKGLTIKSEFTIKNWLKTDTNKFPKRQKDLLVLKSQLDNSQLNKNFGEIIQNRRTYESIMKSLGFKFSGEITDYIKSNFKTKGNILKKFTDNQIQEFVNQSAKLQTVKSIKIADNE